MRNFTKCVVAEWILVAMAFGMARADEKAGAGGSLREKVRARIKERLGGTKPETAESPAGTRGAGDHSLEHGGRTRTYQLHLPGSVAPDKPLPLVIVLHGAGANGRITEVLTGFSKLADEKGFVAAYPDGEKGVWRFWEGGAGDQVQDAAGPGDVGFVAALIDDLVRRKIADPQRVYVTGISNGAYMSNKIACALSDRVAAIAPVSGTLPKRMAERLRPARPMSVLYIHGTADKIVGVQGTDFISKREVSLSAADLAAWWVKNNGCSSPSRDEQLPDTTDDGTTVMRHSYEPGAGGAPVVYYEIRGGGHTWPGGSVQPERLLGKTCRDLNASETIWQFFSQFSLPPKAE